MSALAWTEPMRSRTFDIGIPVVGFAAGLALLIVFGSPIHASAVAPKPISAAATGSLLGVVLDSHGDPVPGAQVRVLDDHGAALATTHAGAGEGALSLGEFRFDDLPAGVYQVAATLPGADHEAHARVPIASFEDTRVRLHLDLGY